MTWSGHRAMSFSLKYGKAWWSPTGQSRCTCGRCQNLHGPKHLQLIQLSIYHQPLLQPSLPKSGEIGRRTSSFHHRGLPLLPNQNRNPPSVPKSQARGSITFEHIIHGDGRKERDGKRGRGGASLSRRRYSTSIVGQDLAQIRRLLAFEM